MKKLLLILMAAFLVAGVNAQVDLQVNRVYFQKYENNSGKIYEQLRIVIQNNGPDAYEGRFSLAIFGAGATKEIIFDGKIQYGGLYEIGLDLSSESLISVQLDSRNQVAETNEDNNWWHFKSDEPLVKLLASDLIAYDLRDTLYLTPGEVYSEQFSVRDMNGLKSIIGVDFKMRTYDLGDKDCYFSTTFTYVQNMREGYEASITEEANGSYKMLGLTLLANSSEAASDYHWLGSYWGLANYLKVGEIARIDISADVAQADLSSSSHYVSRILKIRDAIRGDITGDGTVNREDFGLLKNVVGNYLYNPWGIWPNMYTNKGVNYGAGRIIFSQPDFLSVALLNIWLNNPNDPLVQGLGIGELMSKNLPGSEASAVKPIDNTFAVSENGEVTIDAPEADVYNIVAQDVNGKMIQRTGRLGEEIILPADAKNIRVETAKIKNGTTGLFNASVGPKISVFPNPVTDYVNISSPEKGKMSVISLSGQEIYSSAINAQESLTLSTGDWEKGVYLIKIATENGQSTVKVVK